MDSEQEALKNTLFTRLHDASKQCQSHFGRHRDRKELATEGDARISCLLAQLEAVLHHGLRKTAAGNTFPSLKHVAHMVSKLGLESELSNEAEIARFLQLKQIRTDAGRGRAWLRAALNEKSLERVLETLIANALLLEQFYDDWAFMRDSELVETLPQIAKGLSTMIFALNIDNAELDCGRGIPNETSDLLSDARKAPQPILSLGNQNHNVSAAKKAKTRRKPLVNVVSFSENSASFSENEGTMKVLKQSPVVKPDNPLLSNLISNWNDSKHSQSERTDSTSSRNYSVGSDDTFATAYGDSQRSTPIQEISVEDSEKMLAHSPETSKFNGDVAQLVLTEEDADQVFLPLADESEPAETESVASEENGRLSSNLSERSDVDQQEPEESSNQLRAQMTVLKDRHELIRRSYEDKIERLKSENESLREQLKNYVNAVKLLKSDDGETTESAGPSQNEQNSTGDEIACYEEKLIQVAAMHAELIEFNDRMVRQLSRKSVHIRRLRLELTQLRGPLSDGFSDDEENMNVGEDHLPARPLVNIWIPSAFLSGKGTDVHHVYQIYIRLGNTEWNVYRRYSEFVKFHQQIKKQDSAVATISFPPKKSVGKKEKKFVEERRKSLEQYLRSAVNHAIQNCPEFAALPVNRETICNQMPFLGESRVSRQQEAK